MTILEHESSLPSCLVRPDSRRGVQRELFPEDLHESLAMLRVSMDELKRWKSRGWIPFDLQREMENAYIQHIIFVRDVVRSGLGDAQITLMMDLLPDYLLADPDRIVYSFTHGWVEPAPPEPWESVVKAYVEDLAEAEDWDALIELNLTIERLLIADNETESDSED